MNRIDESLARHLCEKEQLQEPMKPILLCVKDAPLFYVLIIIIDITYVSIYVSNIIVDHIESW